MIVPVLRHDRPPARTLAAELIGLARARAILLAADHVAAARAAAARAEQNPSRFSPYRPTTAP